jgi:hypothetical protein
VYADRPTLMRSAAKNIAPPAGDAMTIDNYRSAGLAFVSPAMNSRRLQAQLRPSISQSLAVWPTAWRRRAKHQGQQSVDR